ncbi:MAG: translesion error-prone DNA polymerase V autoproteolytic subunit [Alphaproteobacteria bacterium]|jgi:DNA polymerase V|nr:translesion error-prone DNA polymerase V autoproteolytic subunit [Alphaproteobacteria bacterium]MBT5390590.1 translesion error-prone DNA polymerase V autoproteolytic subunit [Alphaproteobacteria bacterium]MBT5655055.1 translesion error-prone DNA polymerase V autoproteolytic subunit [Alphaproteobacteria bacterium]
MNQVYAQNSTIPLGTTTCFKNFEPILSNPQNVFYAETNKKTPVTLYIVAVSAGFPTPAKEHMEGPLDLNEHLVTNPESMFFVRVSGDSMVGAGINPSDLLVVDKSLSPDSGRIAVVAIDDQLTVKRLYKEKDELFLLPENPKYPKLVISEDMNVKIWGVVTHVIHPV